MEFLLGLALGWPLLMIFIFAALIAEHNESHGWTVLFTLALGTLAVLGNVFTGVTATMWLMLLGGWIPVGLVWSLWRWRKHCDRMVEKARQGFLSKQQVKDKLDPQTALGTITQWVIAWPFSLLESLIGDVIDVIQSLIKGVFRGTYERISAKALVKLEEFNDLDVK